MATERDPGRDLAFRQVIEDCFPLPLSVTFRKLRQQQDEPPSKQLKQLVELLEATVIFLAAIVCRFYLRDDGRDKRINELLKGFDVPKLGNWVELLRETLRVLSRGESPAFLVASLQAFYFEKIEGGQTSEIYPHAERLRRLMNLDSKAYPLSPTNGQLLDLAVLVRNKKIGHGALMTEPEYLQILDCMRPILHHLFAALDPLKGYPLYHVQEVKVENQIFVHSMQRCMGRDFEQEKIRTADRALNSREVYICRLEAPGDQETRIAEAVSLSPYVIVEQCPVCKLPQVFLFNSRKGRSIDYLSYSCGHSFVPDWYSADFESISDFLAGKVSVEELFKGKTLGKEFPSTSMGVTAEDKREAVLKLSKAKDHLKEDEFALARREIEDAIELNRDLAESHFLLALCSIFEGGDVAAILFSLRSAVSLDPENARYLLALARTQQVLEKVDEARDTLQAVIKVDPSNQEARSLLAELPAPNSPVAQ